MDGNSPKVELRAGNALAEVPIDEGCITKEELAEWLKLVESEIPKAKITSSPQYHAGTSSAMRDTSQQVHERTSRGSDVTGPLRRIGTIIVVFLTSFFMVFRYSGYPTKSELQNDATPAPTTVPGSTPNRSSKEASEPKPADPARASAVYVAPIAPAPVVLHPTGELADKSVTTLLKLVGKHDAARVQQRLIDLGYLTDHATRNWDRKSKVALRTFKRANSLSDDDHWDMPTQLALFSQAAQQNR
jgi:hypothetical protein